MPARIHVGDIGTALQYQCLDENSKVIDVSAATAITILYVLPLGGRLSVAGLVVTDGKDGWVQHVTAGGDLSQAGIWTRQVIITFGISEWHSDVGMFNVWANS